MTDIVLRIGQRVQYVDDRRRPTKERYLHETFPTLGSIYTVREIVPYKALGYDEDGLHLMEVINATRQYSSPRGPITGELAFRVSRFRPVRTANIAVFRRMLVPAAQPVSPSESSAWEWLESVEKDAFCLKDVKAREDQPLADLPSVSNWWDEAETAGFVKGWAAHNTPKAGAKPSAPVAPA
jgi:hypothetical protein